MFRSLILDLNAVVPACGAHASGMFILLNYRFGDKLGRKNGAAQLQVSQNLG